jgi:hypothetical protein
MAKRIDIDGKSYRMRRGKLVEIPPEWVGKTTSEKTIRQRPSKLTGKVKRVVKDVGGVNRFKDQREAPVETDEDQG